MPIALSSVPTVKMQEMGGCWVSCCDRVKGRTEQMPCWWPSGTLAKGEEEGTARRDSGEIKENRDGDAREKKRPAEIRCIASGPDLNWQRANKQRIDRQEKIQGDRRLVQVSTIVSGEAESHHMRDVVEIMGKGGGPLFFWNPASTVPGRIFGYFLACGVSRVSTHFDRGRGGAQIAATKSGGFDSVEALFLVVGRNTRAVVLQRERQGKER